MEPPVFDATISDRERDRLTREWRERVKQQQQTLAKIEASIIKQKKEEIENSTPLPGLSPDKRRKIDDNVENVSEKSTSNPSEPSQDAKNPESAENDPIRPSAKTFFVCDKCKGCMEFVKMSKAGSSECKNCGCDLIFHLKDESEPDDALDADDYLEWDEENEDVYGAQAAAGESEDDDAMDYTTSGTF